MTEQQYMAELQEAENIRRRLVGEMMGKPFEQRVMSANLESELDSAECKLLDCPPIIGHETTGEPIYPGKGLLEETPEETEWVKSVSPLSMKVIPQNEWPAYIDGKGGEDQLAIENYVVHILNQASTGSCAGEGISGGIMAAENQSGQTPTKLNGYFPYHWSSGGSDRGSTLSANIRVTQERGVASEAVWPRSNGFRRTPSQAAMEDATQHRLLKFERISGWDEFGTALLNTWPVYFGYPGHAIYAVRLLSPTRLKYANSWSRNWGENGFGTLSNSRIQWGYNVYVIMVASENRQ